MQVTLARLPSAAQAGVGIGVSVACAVCFHLFWATPVREDLAARERALAKAHGDVAAAVNIQRGIPEGRRAVAALALRLQALRGAVPADADGASVLREMQVLAAESGLWITAWKPAPPASRASMTEWSVGVEFDGTYASLMTFLQRVGADSRLVTVSALRVRAHERRHDESTLAGACQLTTFVPRDVAPPDVAPGDVAPEPQFRRTAR